MAFYMETLLAWLAAAIVIAWLAMVGRWYWQSPRDWPESVALMVCVAACAGLLGLLHRASESEALGELAAGLMLGWAIAGVVAVAAVSLGPGDR